MLAPAGAPELRLKVSVSPVVVVKGVDGEGQGAAGVDGAVADGKSKGGRLGGGGGTTVTEKLAVALSGGEPLSVTRTVIG